MKLVASRSRLALTALATALVCAPVAADWLVTAEGAKIETNGPWKVRGATIVFTSVGGTLSSLRAEEVDLEASERLTREALQERERDGEPKPERPAEAVLVLTNADIGPAAAEPAAAEGSSGESSPAAEAAEAPSGAAGVTVTAPFRVLAWRVTPWSDGVELSGTLQNGGGDRREQVQATAVLLDEEGIDLGQGRLTVTVSVLRPNVATRFLARIPGVDAASVTGLRLDVQSRAVEEDLGSQETDG